MAHRIVDENSLKTVADAIREKAGTSDSLVFPTGFAEAIAGIQAGGGSDEEWFNDGDTHIWITLPEGRTSPLLGVAVNGTVTVDWGDGSTPDVMAGTTTTPMPTSLANWTPTHEYPAAGSYIIRLTVDGEMGMIGDSSTNGYSFILRHSSGASPQNHLYQRCVKKVELGRNVTTIGKNAFYNCGSLEYIHIANSVKSINDYAFYNCSQLKALVLPDGVSTGGGYAFTFMGCHALESIVIPSGASIGGYAFSGCNGIKSVVIRDGVTEISTASFQSCKALVSAIIHGSVTRIKSNAFYECGCAKLFDFTKCTAVPTLEHESAFSGIPADFEIRVPAALYDEWIVATNWSTYASNIVAV